MQSIRIPGTGYYVPPKRLKNTDLEKMGLDTTDKWIQRRTGIKERRMADPHVSKYCQILKRSRRAVLFDPSQIRQYLFGFLCHLAG